MDPRTSVLTSKWAPDLHFEVKMVPKWCPEVSLETPWAYFGGLGGDVGAPEGFLEALGEHFGALGAASGPLGSAPGTVLGSIFGHVWDYFGVYFARAVVARIYLYFGRSPFFCFYYFKIFLKWRRSLPIGNYQ